MPSFIESGFTSRVEYEKAMGGGSAVPGGTYSLFYWTKCSGFLGRAFAPIMILEQAGAKYECKDTAEKPAGTFAVPAIVTPSGTAIASRAANTDHCVRKFHALFCAFTGASVSQVAAICYTLGHELGMAPSSAADDAKCLQLCCDVADLVSEADKEGKLEGDRKAKWLSHFDDAVSKPHETNYADFAIFHGLAIIAVFKSTSTELSDLPPGLKAWFQKMMETKGVKAAFAKGTDLMPGGRAIPKL